MANKTTIEEARRAREMHDTLKTEYMAKARETWGRPLTPAEEDEFDAMERKLEQLAQIFWPLGQRRIA